MKASLTERQNDLYLFIRNYMMRVGKSPSIEEMRVGINSGSKSGTHRLLDGLVERGWIVRIRGRARALALQAEPIASNIDLSDLRLREALIAAGWTPPQEKEAA